MSTSEDKKNESKSKKTNTFFPILIAILICIALLGLAPFVARWYALEFLKQDISGLADSGIFGDSFGFANALISAAAFAGVIVSMYLQRKDLELQRESIEIQQQELKNNTKALTDQKIEFEAQNKTMKLQRFENTFFNMLSLQQEITSELVFNCEVKTLSGNSMLEYSGREVFSAMYKEARLRLNTSSQTTISYHYGIINFLTEEGIDNFLKIEDISIFHHYFRHLYRIVKFIDETSLLETKNEKYSYTSILRSTLSKYEFLLLFYNSLFYPDFKRLIEEYSLLHNLQTEFLSHEENDIKRYRKSAFDPDINGYNKQIK